MSKSSRTRDEPRTTLELKPDGSLLRPPGMPPFMPRGAAPSAAVKEEVSEETDEDDTVCHLATDADEQEGGAQSSACQSVPQCGTEAPARGGVQRNHLLGTIRKYYELHCPWKLNIWDGLCRKYAGKEAVWRDTLATHYGAAEHDAIHQLDTAPTVEGPYPERFESPTGEPLKRLKLVIRRYYELHAPWRLKEWPALCKLYASEELAWRDVLAQKYGVHSTDCYAGTAEHAHSVKVQAMDWQRRSVRAGGLSTAGEDLALLVAALPCAVELAEVSP